MRYGHFPAAQLRPLGSLASSGIAQEVTVLRVDRPTGHAHVTFGCETKSCNMVQIKLNLTLSSFIGGANRVKCYPFTAMHVVRRVLHYTSTFEESVAAVVSLSFSLLSSNGCLFLRRSAFAKGS